MKLFGKILTAIGALAGAFYLIQKAISWVYENTVERYVVFDDEKNNIH